MIAKIRAAFLVSVMLAGVAACGSDQQAPSSPTPFVSSVPAAPPVPSVTSLTLTGKTSSTGVGDSDGAWLGMVPGEMARLIATATFSDNTERDVTAEAVWNCDAPDVATILSPGVIRAQTSGWASITAKYGSAVWSDGRNRAGARLRVVAEGVFLLGVAVGDGRWALADVRVQVASSAGTFSAVSSPEGLVFLPAVGSTTVQVDKAGYVTIRESVTVSKDEYVLYTLQPSSTAPSAVR